MKMFKEDIPNTLSGSIDDLTKLANTTLANLVMAEAVDLYSVSKINDHIDALKEAKLVITDIDTDIWAFAQKAVQGQNIE